MTRRATVFLSHNSADKPAVEALALRLHQEADIEPWLDKWNLIPGAPWQEELERAIAGCDVCAICIGPTGLGAWHHEEMLALINRRVSDRQGQFRIIPVLLPGAERGSRSSLPTFLVATTWVEFRRTLDDAEAFQRLLCGIRGQKPGPPSNGRAVLAECPYRGLEFFDVAHAGRFFGREAVTQWLVDDIRKSLRPDSDLPRLLAILGASGSGKSSLARAGLYAALQGGSIEGSHEWRFVPPLRPGTNPLESLELAVLQAAAGSPQLETIRHELRELADKPDRLHRAARLLVTDTSPPRRLFLLVDQFEEVFTTCEKEETRRAFIAALLHAARERGGPVVLAITMRADFYSKVAAYEQLARVVDQHQYLVGPMSEAELRLAIEQPAVRAGAEFEPGLVDKFLEDVHRQPGALPLLEHALLELWNKREDGRRLTHAAYEAIGRLEGSLERRANKIFRHFNADDQELCRRAFLRLVHPGEGAEDTKRRVQLRELLALGDGTRIQKLIETLAAPDARLVVTEGGDTRQPSGFVEVAHETLIRSWSQLRKWLDEDRSGLRTQRRLTEAAREWDESGRNSDFLYSGGRLAVATEFATHHADEFNALETEFLAASQQHQTDAHAESLRKEHERADEQARSARRARKLMRFATAFALLALLAAALAVRYGTTVVAQKKELRRQLATAAFDVGLERLAGGKEGEGVALLARAARLGDEAASVRLQSLLFNRRLPRLVSVMEPTGKVSSSSFSPDGCWVLTASGSGFGGSGAAQVWEAATGKPVSKPMPLEGFAPTAMFSPDGRWVLTVSHTTNGSGEARVWEAATGRPRSEAMRSGGEITKALFSPDSQTVLTLSSEGGVTTGQLSWAATPIGKVMQMWTASTGTPISAPIRSEGDVEDMMFTADSQRVLGTSRMQGGGFVVRVWEAKGGKLLSTLPIDAEISEAKFSPDGKHLVTVFKREATEARVWNASTGEAVTKLSPSEGAEIRDAQFSPDGRWLLMISKRGDADEVRMCDAKTGHSIGGAIRVEDRLEHAQFSPNGRWVLTVSGRPGVEGMLRLWQAGTTNSISEPIGFVGYRAAAAFSPDSRWVFVAEEGLFGTVGKTRVWEMASDKPVCEPIPVMERMPNAALERLQRPRFWFAVSNRLDGTNPLSDSYVVEIDTGRRISGPMTVTGIVTEGTVSSDGRRLLTVSSSLDGKKVHRIWEVPTHELKWEWILEPSERESLGQSLSSYAFSPDGGLLSMVADGVRNHIVEVRKADTGKLLFQRIVNSATMPYSTSGRCATFSHDSRWLVTLGDMVSNGERMVQVWEAATGKPASEQLLCKGDTDMAILSKDRQWVVGLSSFGQGSDAWRFGASDISASLLAYAEATFGQKVDDSNGVLSPAEDQLSCRAAHPELWFFQDSSTGRIAPWSETRIPDWIESRLPLKSERQRRELEDHFPGHPLVAAGLALYAETRTNRRLPTAGLLAKSAEIALLGIEDTNLRARMHYWLSRYELAARQLILASNHVAQALALNPAPGRFWFQAAEVAAERGDTQGELSAIDEALWREPTNAIWWVRRGYLMGRDGDPGAATTNFARALAAQASNDTARVAVGWAWLGLKRPDHSLAVFPATNATKSSAEALAGRAAAAWLANRASEAQDCYSRLAQKDEEFAEPSLWSSSSGIPLSIEPARALSHEVRQALSNVCASLPWERRYSLEALTNMALANLDSDARPDTIRALEQYEGLLRLFPGSPEWLNLRGEALAKLGEHEEALASFREAAMSLHATSSLQVRAWLNATWVLRETLKPPRLDDALAAARSAIKSEPTNHFAWRELARCLEATGQPQEALQTWLRLVMVPGHTDQDIASASFWAVQQGELPAAQELLKQGNAEFRDSPVIAESEGWLFLNLGQPEAALKAFQRLQGLVGTEKPASLLAGLAVSNWLLGRESEAEALYETLIRQSPKWAQADYLKPPAKWTSWERSALEAVRASTTTRNPTLAPR